MKKIIDGKRYDTETATHIANFDNGLSRGDFRWLDEDLYQTPKGNWFIHGTGGAMTSWREAEGQNSWAGGEGIRPLTAEEAREWCECFGKTKVIETYFADQIEDA